MNDVKCPNVTARALQQWKQRLKRWDFRRLQNTGI